MYSVYMLLSQDFQRRLEKNTKEAITLPPNDFEKNERLYVKTKRGNKREKKTEDSRIVFVKRSNPFILVGTL